MNDIKTINERLGETEPDYIAHVIACDLDDKLNIYIDEDKQQEISLIISNENILQDEQIQIADAICMNIIEDIICFNSDEQEMKAIIKNILDNRKKIFINYKKYWRRQKDLQSPVYSVREIARLEEKIMSLKVKGRLDKSQENQIHVLVWTDGLKSLKKCEEEKLVQIEFSSLFDTLDDNDCLKDLEEFPGEYCEYCKYNNYDPSVGIFNQCMRED